MEIVSLNQLLLDSLDLSLDVHLSFLLDITLQELGVYVGCQGIQSSTAVHSPKVVVQLPQVNSCWHSLHSQMVGLFVIRVRFIIFIMEPFLGKLPIRVSFSSDIVKRWLPWFLLLKFQTLIDNAVSSKPILSGCNVHLIPILPQASSPYRSVFISVVIHSLGHGRIIIFVP